MVSYLFQHPWDLGLPLGLTAILVHLDDPASGRARASLRLGALGLLVAATGLSQAALFAALAASLAVAEILDRGRPTAGRALGSLLAIGAGVAVAGQLGMMFLPQDAAESSLIVQPWVAGSPADSGLWVLATYGLLLPLGLAGLACVRRGRVLLGLLVVGGLVVVQVVRYRFSWDMAKFATVSALGLSIAASATLHRLFALRPRIASLTLGVALLVGSTAAGVSYPLIFAFRPDLVPEEVFARGPAELTADDAEAVRWLRPRVGADEAVFRRYTFGQAYAQLGGLPVPWFDNLVPTHGFAGWRLRARERLLTTMPDDPDAWLAQHVAWFVLAPEDEPLASHAERWIARGRAREVARFGKLRVIRLSKPPGRAGPPGRLSGRAPGG
jgi:hypothetical protein